MSSGSGSGALALAAVPRGVQESGPLACDYPARGGVPQCLAAATKPIELAPGIWEVQAGLPMEAFWCAHGPQAVTGYNFTPTAKGKGKAKMRRGAGLACIVQMHALGRTAADTLALTDAGRGVPGGTCVWSATWVCTGEGNCLRQCGGEGACEGGCTFNCTKRRGRCSFQVHVTATREQVERGVWRVRAQGCHVKCGTAPVPPAVLRWTRLARSWAVERCNSTNVAPLVVAGLSQAEVGPGGSGKHAVKHKQLAKARVPNGQHPA